MRVAAQGTGHAATALAEGSLHDTILVKTHRMRVVEIDPDSRRARAQAGAMWADVVGPASEHGLAALAGSSHDVGVVGYCLGGGVSWLARKHGLAANSVAAVQIVTADGRVVVADAHHEPDLFWAVRGGGGNFGIVTAIELELYPVDELYAGMLAFPVERAAEILRAWREWVRTVPDEATSVGRHPALPAVRGDPRAAARAVVRRRRDGLPRRRGGRFGAARAAARAAPRDGHVRAGRPRRPARAAHGPAARRCPGVGDGALLDVMPAEAIDALAAVSGAGHAAAVGRAAPPRRCARPRAARATAPWRRWRATSRSSPSASRPTPTRRRRSRPTSTWSRAPSASGTPAGATSTSPRRPSTPARAYSAAAYRRLRAVKTLVDPDDVFRANHPIAPID